MGWMFTERGRLIEPETLTGPSFHPTDRAFPNWVIENGAIFHGRPKGQDDAPTAPRRDQYEMIIFKATTQAFHFSP
ncbi:MAG TPA: hypothetical protein DD706_24180 [Nitrospiraceae bacterium]|nr:hypothetical protein [Nitrospiraceae bacterium]